MTSRAEEAPIPVHVQVTEAESLQDRLKDIYQSVARRAHELFDARGREHGSDMNDWLQAERELLLPVPVDVEESESEYTVHAELPGLHADNIDLTVEPHRLFISGKTERSQESPMGDAIYSEHGSSEVFHLLNLSNEVDPSGAEAVLRNGKLEITLPKRSESKE